MNYKYLFFFSFANIIKFTRIQSVMRALKLMLLLLAKYIVNVLQQRGVAIYVN